MPGLIDKLAAERRARAAQERGRAAHKAIEEAGRKEVERREGDADARVAAMHAVKAMTGRVIFPARWDMVPVEERYRRCCAAIFEGRVGIHVYTNMGRVERVLVFVPGSEKRPVAWERPRRHDLPPNKQPLGPHRGWFLEALGQLGVI